jgi:hypothetical protein
MKTCLQTLQNTNGWLLALAALLTACQLRTAVADDQPPRTGFATVTVQTGGGGSATAGSGTGSSQSAVVVKTIEKTAEAEVGDDPPARQDRSWLGVGVEEASEALASQLGLAPGVGLLVTYVAPDSPAAKADFQKNDVLVEFEGQSLVHPDQLRKLVQVRKEGDTVALVFYRAGKKQTVSATLGKTPAGFGALEDEQAWKGDLAELSRQFWNLPIGDAIRDSIKVYRDSLGHLEFDQKKVQEEVRHSMEQAKRACEDAIRHSTNAASSALAEAFKKLQRSGLMANNSASVTVRSTGERVKSIVKADESGTIVIVSNPNPRLTAHDKDGKLLFDGEIDTPEQRSQVPPELWEKVEPLLDKLAPKAEEEPATESAPPKKQSSRFGAPRAPAPVRVAPTL